MLLLFIPTKGFCLPEITNVRGSVCTMVWYTITPFPKHTHTHTHSFFNKNGINTHTYSSLQFYHLLNICWIHSQVSEAQHPTVQRLHDVLQRSLPGGQSVAGLAFCSPPYSHLSNELCQYWGRGSNSFSFTWIKMKTWSSKWSDLGGYLVFREYLLSGGQPCK